jgi:neopullulanase
MSDKSLFHTPDWVKDAVFYQIFPDRFAHSSAISKPSHLQAWDSPPTTHGFKGGDLRGVLEHLDYLQDLGVTAIYFNPIFQSAANHRYHTYDYYQVDPILGGNEAFCALLDAAHARSIRVVLDGVFNHASRGFFQFNHILENGADSPYLDWFVINEFPLNAYTDDQPNYGAWWGLPALPEFDTANPTVREFLMRVAEHWIREGIDGWRLDVPLDIDTPGFWSEFRRRVKGLNPDTYILAEIWDNAVEWLRGDHFDAVMHYGLNRACLGFFGGADLDRSAKPGEFEIQPLGGAAFADEIDRVLDLYPWEVTLAQFSLLSSHDMPRFLTLVGGNKDRLRLATLFQMTYPGAPCIYYGDEIGLEGGKDPDCRRSFPWDESRWDRDLLRWFRRCTALRHAHPALRRGTLRRLHADESTYAFARQWEKETLFVVFNASASHAQIDLPMPDGIAEGTELKCLLSDSRWTVIDGKVTILLPPLSARVLR